MTTAVAYDVTFRDRDRTFYWAVVISILLHVIVLVPFLKDMIPEEFFEAQVTPAAAEPIEFVFVNPPSNPSPRPQDSRFLSTQDALAQDRTQNDDVNDVPESEGLSPFPENPSPTDGSEGGGENELPPLPEEVADLGEAFEKSRFLKQSSPQRGPSAAPEAPAFDSQGSARASVGGIQINTTAWDFAPYLLDLKQRIKQHWIPPLAFTALGAIHGYTKINFRIYPDGRMEAMSVIETKGHDSLHRASGNAIKGAAPFRPLPDDFPEEYLDITFGFYYLLPGDREEYLRKQE